MVACGFLIGLVASMVVYRGFFHRLCRFPGPFLARISKFYTVTTAAKSIQQHVNYSELHAQCGDFVRVGTWLAAPRPRRGRGGFMVLTAPARSSRALHQLYEPRVAAKTNLLISRIASHLGKPVDMTQRSMFYGFDTMGDLCK